MATRVSAGIIESSAKGEATVVSTSAMVRAPKPNVSLVHRSRRSASAMLGSDRMVPMMVTHSRTLAIGARVMTSEKSQAPARLSAAPICASVP